MFVELGDSMGRKSLADEIAELANPRPTRGKLSLVFIKNENGDG